MLSAAQKKNGSLIGQSCLNPQVRFGAHQKEGRLLLRTIERGLNDPDTAFTIQRLRDQLFFYRSDKIKGGGKTVGFAGPTGSEGATSLSILLALSMGEVPRNRVVFIDGRLEQKSFAIYSKMFALKKYSLSYNNGSDYFQCYSTRNQNLCFLMPGTSIDSLDLFSNKEVGFLIEALREAFDYVIFDMPPLLGSTATRMLIPHLDLFFLVCVPLRTRLAEVEESKRIMGDIGGTMQGVILNRQKVPFWTALFGREAFL